MDEIDFIPLFALFALAGVVVIVTLSATIPPEYSFYDTSIISLNDGSELSGSFGLGSGSIREDPVFIYYRVDGKGYRLETVPADMTLIVEDEERSPFIRTLIRKRWGGMPVPYGYELHVPDNTIIRAMSLDAKLRE